MKSLQTHGLVAREASGTRYVLGPALLELSSVYLDTLDVRARSMRWMHELSRSTGLATRLGVEHFGRVIVIHHDRRPDGSEQMPETGVAIPSHASALGKVLLAFDAEHAAAVLAHPLDGLTGETITEPDALRAEFARVEATLLGEELDEAVIGEASVAVPVFAAGGDVVAALAIVLPSTDWPADDAALAQLRDAARAISRELGAPAYPASSPRDRRE